MADMIVMCGNISVGKSFFARKIADALHYRYINIDDCYAILNGDERIHENKFEVWQLFFQLIHKCIELDQSVVVDTNAPFISDRQEFLNWFPEFNMHSLIWVDAPMGLALEKNRQRRRVVPNSQILDLASRFNDPCEQEPGGRSVWNNILRIEHDFKNKPFLIDIKGDLREKFREII